MNWMKTVLLILKFNKVVDRIIQSYKWIMFILIKKEKKEADGPILSH